MRASRLCQPIRKQHALHVKLQIANIPFCAAHIQLAKFLDLNDVWAS